MAAKDARRTGATPKGQGRLGRPYDSWRAPTLFGSGRLFNEAFDSQRRRIDYSGCVGVLKGERSSKTRLQVPEAPRKTMQHGERTYDIRDREALASDIGDPMEANDHGGSLGTEDKERKGRCHSKGSVSPRATIRQLEGTDAILEREAFKRGFREPLDATEDRDYDSVRKEK